MTIAPSLPPHPSAEPGSIRVVGNGSPLLSNAGLTIEVMGCDGAWAPVKGVTSLRLIASTSLALPTVAIEAAVTEVDLILPADAVTVTRRKLMPPKPADRA